MSDRVIAAKRPEKKGLWYGDLLAFFWSCSFVIKCRQIKKEFNQKRQVKKTSDIWAHPGWMHEWVFALLDLFAMPVVLNR